MKAEELEHQHTVSAIRERLQQQHNPTYLRDWVYGGIDGAVTTFAVVAGVIGANLNARIILILGLANLLADGLSMAAGNYSGTKTERDDYERLREIEHRHVRLEPHGEREEIRQILQAKGLQGSALEDAVEAITSDEERWVATMLTEEYGLALAQRSPLRSGASTFFAFLICGSIPLLPFLLSLPSPFVWSIILTGITFALIGSAKSRWSLAPWWLSGFETLAIGGAAAGVAFGVGYLLKTLV